VKQQDIAIIIIIVFVSGVMSFFISNKFISPPAHDLTAPKVQPITADFAGLDKRFFNEKSINPTQIIRVEVNKNQNPIKGQQ
jgi:hypothetical protein